MGTAWTFPFSLDGFQHQQHQPTIIVITVEESLHLEAATHTGEAPPAAAQYNTMTPEAYKSLRLFRDLATCGKQPNTEASPAYSEISGQASTCIEQNEHDL